MLNSSQRTVSDDTADVDLSAMYALIVEWSSTMEQLFNAYTSS